MSIDIVSTTYRNTEKLEMCLSSVVEHTKFVDYRWYVWANDPNDKVKQVIHDSMYIDDILFNDRIEPIYNDNNDGSFSSNNNEAAAEGNGEYILFLNDDIVAVKDDWLLNMQRVLDTDQNVGVVGSLLLYPDKKSIQHCGVFFSDRTNNLPYHMFYKQPINKVAGFITKYRYYQAVTGACMLVRRKDFEKLGGFIEEFHYNFEDVALCLMMKEKLKKRCVYCPTSVLIHDEGISANRNDKTEHNVKVLREKCSGMYFNDLDFYLSNPNYMLYKLKY